MGVYQQFQADQVADVVFAEGFTVRIRSRLHPKMRAFQNFQLKKYRQYLGGGNTTVPQEVEDQIDIEKAAAAIEGWTGGTDEAGEPLPYTPANASKLVTDLEWFRVQVLAAVNSLATFQKAELADLGKDSSRSSAPTSSGPTDAS